MTIGEICLSFFIIGILMFTSVFVIRALDNFTRRVNNISTGIYDEEE